MLIRLTIPLFLLIIPKITTAQEKAKYWVFFTDKMDGYGKRTQVEDNYLTHRAMTRRSMRGEPNQEHRFALQDTPISKTYEADFLHNGFTIEHRSRWLNAVTSWLTENEREQVENLSYVRTTRSVEYLTTDMQPTPTASPVIAEKTASNCDRSFFGNSMTHLSTVNACSAIMEGINGTGVILGFIDTQFHRKGDSGPFSHPSLKHIPQSNRLLGVRDFTRRDPSQDCPGVHSHGMSVASVAAGYDEGILIGPGHGAMVYGASTECSLYERNIEEDNFVAGVEWLESEGVDVINISLGYSRFDDGQKSYTPNEIDGDTGLTTIALDLAAQRGVISVTSTGNSGPMKKTVSTPADADSVISVGATIGQTSDDVIFFSSRGPTADGRIKPDVVAPGFRIWNAEGTANGTSLSSPIVAGVVAQILQVNPDLGPMDVWRLLTSTASKSSSPNNDHGWGGINADAAIKSAQLLVSSNRVPPIPDNLILHAPYPNPFQNITHFTVEAGADISHARLMIYDLLGREVNSVYQGPIPAGGIPLQFDGTDLSPGVYVYTLEFAGHSQSGKLVRMGN